MTDEPRTPAARWRRLASFVVVTVVFGLSHTQAPLYYSNQHQYFLHGLARAGFGELGSDWLASTADPTPVFSALVEFTHRYLDDALFHVCFFLLLGLYANALVGIFRHLTGRDVFSAAGLLFVTLLAFVHAGSIRWCSAYLFGKDYPWYLQAGVAGQYVLGPGLQPSVIGVLLLVTIDQFLCGRPWLAIVCVGLTANVHSTYLPSAAFLTLAFMYVIWRRGEGRRALLLGAASLLLVMPVLTYDLLKFAPSDGSTFALAQQIIAHDRIPHHAQPAKWFDLIAALQYGWIIGAVLLARRTALSPLMLIPFLLSVALTLVQVVTSNDTLALLFPWRTTAILVPIATTVFLARFCEWVGAKADSRLRLWRALVGGSAFMMWKAIFLGLLVMGEGGTLAYRTSWEEERLLDHVRRYKQAGDLYLIPVEVPNLKAGSRGVVSTSFTPPPKRDKQEGLISVDLQRFRLYTGAPIFVDFKSIPYKDREVIEWWERIQLVKWLYLQPDWSVPKVRQALRLHQITHVVALANKPLRGVGEVAYRDGAYILYRVVDKP